MSGAAKHYPSVYLLSFLDAAPVLYFKKRTENILTLICPLMLIFIFSMEEKRQINFFQKLFSEPVETVYIIMKDGTPFNYSSYYEDKVYMSIGRLEETLKSKNKNYSIKDIAIVIHNHLKDCKFSHEDRKQYRRLKKYGFNGLFMLYSNMTKKTYILEDKKKDLT